MISGAAVGIVALNMKTLTKLSSMRTRSTGMAEARNRARRRRYFVIEKRRVF
jgi:hypothetical protein